ncbi:hypothetical protein [Streptomyces justiciae]|uniref:Uncharacterized protein n=1 Tax=Streptomyces justiciae TaxID=2780140 RepID=A0ABU3M6P4_9ACTN|nr:hypothetical protein [Streptomyces justiciae]MDT7847197.1 hypothetical protein [Streptomyces justiciae]
MRVVVREAFKAYINHQPEDFHPGQIIKGDTAVYFLRSHAAVDPADDEAAELAESLRESEEAGGSQVLEPSEPKQAPATGTGGDPTSPPQELDIDASVKDVLAWVGDDRDRAAEVLSLEQAKEHPRSTLVKQLEKTAAGE